MIAIQLDDVTIKISHLDLILFSFTSSNRMADFYYHVILLYGSYYSTPYRREGGDIVVSSS
jgi:hypothetical protein